MKIGRKISGGRYKRPKKKKSTGRQGQARVVKVGEVRQKVIRGRGGNEKNVLFSGNICNIVVDGKSQQTKIKNVVSTPSNIFLARRNILVKGAIVETELGNAKITNRPSQEGQIQAVLIK